MADGLALGAVEVDVGANLDKLLRGFAEAERAADRFDQALEKRVRQSSGNAQRATESLAAAEKRLGQSLETTTRSATRYAGEIKRAGDESVVAGRKSATAFDQVRRSLLASAGVIGTAFGANFIKNTLDSYTRFTNQLKVAGLEGQALVRVQDQLFESAQRYGVQLESLGSLYGRLAQSQSALGATAGQMMQFTNGVAAAIKVQGANAASSQGALLQLSQAMGSTIVRAEEFNSINEGARPILVAVANGIERYGGSVSKLRAEVIKGQLTSQEFFSGFLKGSAQLEAQAERANLTIGMSFQTLNNALGRYLGQTDEAYSITVRFGMAIKALADNLDTVMPILTALILAIGARYAAALGAATLATVRKAAADAQATLAATALAGANGRVVASMGAVNAANVLTAASSARLAGSMGAVTAATMVQTTRIAGITVAMRLASAGALTLGRTMLAAMGGPVGVAIMAIAGAVFLYHRRVAEAEAQVASFNKNQAEAKEILEAEAIAARDTSGAVKNLGTEHSAAVGRVRAFAGATGDAANALWDQAKAARAARMEVMQTAQVNAQQDRANATSRLRELYGRAGMGNLKPDASGPGGMQDPNAVFGARRAEQMMRPFADEIRQTIAQHRAADRTFNDMIKAQIRASADPLESYVPNARTGGRDLGAEIADLQQQLVAATRTHNEAAMIELNKQIKFRKRISELMETGLSLEIANAQASAEALGSGGGAGNTERKSTITLANPVDGPITSGFGHRKRPTAGASSFHPAIDFGVGAGTPVKAPADGVIIRTGRNGGLGNVVWIDHGNGTISELNHLTRATTQIGQQVRQGEQVAVSGATGVGTGAHLDWRVRTGADQSGRGGTYLNLEKQRTVAGSMADADAQAAEAAEREAEEALARQQRYNSDLGQLESQTLAAKRDQLRDEAAIAEFDRAQINRERDAERTEIAIKLQRGEYEETQALALEAANEELREAQLAAIAMREFARVEAAILTMAETRHEAEMAGLDLERDMARTAVERRAVERRILAARKAYERLMLQAIISASGSTAEERAAAQAQLDTLDSRYAGQGRRLNAEAVRDREGTAPEGSDSWTRDQIDAVKRARDERIAIVRDAAQAEIELTGASEEQRLAILQEAADREVEIRREADERIRALEDAKRTMMIESARSIAENLAEISGAMLGKQSAIYRALFATSKAFAIAQASIAMYQNIAKAMSLGFPQNLPFIAAAIAQGASIVANIQAISGSFAVGGWTGSGPRDREAGVVHGQEFVVKAGPAARYRQVLESINRGRDPTTELTQRTSGGAGLMGRGADRPLNVQLQNFAPGVRHEVQEGLSRDEVIIIAREEAPRAVAGDLERPNSRVRKSLQRNTTARGRKR